MRDLIHAALIIVLMGLFVSNLDFGSHRLIGRQRAAGTFLAMCGIMALLALVFGEAWK